MSPSAFRLGMYANGFVLGFVLMGFEMLSSRYLNPFFGSGIFTWAAIISVTLFSLMVGYFIGGRMVDKRPSAGLLGILVLVAAVAMAAIPPLVEPIVFATMDIAGDGPSGVTLAAFVILFVPLTLIACFSPFAVRLLLVSTEASGRQTGMVYGISTCGNILGTLVTSFYLVPIMGTRAITIVFALITAASALSLISMGRRMRARQ